MESKQSIKKLSRRGFMKTTAATSAGVVTGSLLVDSSRGVWAAPLAPSRVIGANDRIHVAVIGVGVMGDGHLSNLAGELAEVDWTRDQFSDNIAVIAACDVWEKRRKRAQQVAKLAESQVYSDYRKLLENKDIDAVVVATPDHWHAPIAIAALEAGKHVYVEKPMTRTLDEALKMWKTAKRTGRLVQVGSQGCSDPIYHRSREIVESGGLGKLLWAQGAYCRNNPKGEWNDYKTIDAEATPQTVDWKMWLGTAPNRPWSPERFFRWRKYWDYGNGLIGDLWPHRLHPLMLSMNLLKFPKSVSCIGGNLCETDGGPGPDGKPYGERREVADTTLMLAEFPSRVMVFLASSSTNERGIEDIIRGQKANLLFGGDKVKLEPERPFADEIKAKDETPSDAGEGYAKHYKNFFESIRNNVPPICDIELGVRVQTVLSLAEMSYRRGKTMHFDPVKLKVLG